MTRPSLPIVKSNRFQPIIPKQLAVTPIKPRAAPVEITKSHLARPTT